MKMATTKIKLFIHEDRLKLNSYYWWPIAIFGWGIKLTL